MIDLAIKKKFIKELEKYGNVSMSCAKFGINRSTYYRWVESDKFFKKISSRAIRAGRKNMCDIAEYALMTNVKEKKMDAIKYFLGHNDPRYKHKANKVLIEHSNANRDYYGHIREEERKKIDQVTEDVKFLGEILRGGNGIDKD